VVVFKRVEKDIIRGWLMKAPSWKVVVEEKKVGGTGTALLCFLGNDEGT